MSLLAPQYSSNRMVREYVQNLYLPAALEYKRRMADECSLARELCAWSQDLARHWDRVRFGTCASLRLHDRLVFTVDVWPGQLSPDRIQVELYADPMAGDGPMRIAMKRVADPVEGSDYLTYVAEVPTDRPAEHFTARIVPYHPNAAVPIEGALIKWQH